jgi:hypothetical protein
VVVLFIHVCFFMGILDIGCSAPDFSNPPVLSNYPAPPEMRAIGLLPLVIFVSLQQNVFKQSDGRGNRLARICLTQTAKNHNALYASMSFGWFLPGMVANAIIFTWVHNNTKGSLLLALLFHTSLNVTEWFLSASPVHPFIGLALKKWIDSGYFQNLGN